MKKSVDKNGRRRVVTRLFDCEGENRSTGESESEHQLKHYSPT